MGLRFVIFSGFIGEQVRVFANVNLCQKDVCLIEKIFRFFDAPRGLVTVVLVFVGL